MSAKDRIHWDTIYRERSHLPYPTPDPLLFDYTPPVDPDDDRRALDLAGGLGQNGLWLAAQGYTVDIMEISRVALRRARREMAARNLRNVNLLQADLEDILLEEEQYDLICIFRYLKKEMMPLICAGTAVGGRVIYETYNINYLDVVPEFNTDFLAMPGQLTEFFPGWKIVHEAEVDYNSQIAAIKTASSG
jgi:tellurite methyltransferase